MTSGAATWKEIESRLTDLPPDDLAKVLEYLDFLAFKREHVQEEGERLAEQQTPYRVVAKLGGLLKNYPITDEDIAAARKEMWSGFGEFDP